MIITNLAGKVLLTACTSLNEDIQNMPVFLTEMAELEIALGLDKVTVNAEIQVTLASE